jgi:hypothetical protein
VAELLNNQAIRLTTLQEVVRLVAVVVEDFLVDH